MFQSVLFLICITNCVELQDNSLVPPMVNCLEPLVRVAVITESVPNLVPDVLLLLLLLLLDLPLLVLDHHLCLYTRVI